MKAELEIMDISMIDIITTSGSSTEDSCPENCGLECGMEMP